MRLVFSRIAVLAAIALGSMFTVLALAGIVRNFSSVPFWDMWQGYLDFYVRVMDGQTSAWWGLHNEHRIIFSRLFFWIDLRFFHGSTWILLSTNIVLVFATWATFVAISRDALPSTEDSTIRRVFAWTSLALLMSWIQQANLTWAFQGQLFAASLFPLLAFFLLVKSASAEKGQRNLYFLASMASGIVSAGTMINGLAALPIMFALAIMLRLPKSYIAVICITSVLIIGFYFVGFPPRAKNDHGLLQVILGNPLQIASFFLAYLGAPFHYIEEGGLTLPIVAGAVAFMTSTFLAVEFLYRRRQDISAYVLIATLLYCALTALGTAAARLATWGISYAFTSRYMTTVLVFWVALILLLVIRFSRSKRSHLILLPGLFAIPLLLVPYQLSALIRNDEAVNRDVAALALELGVRDEVQLGRILDSPDALFMYARTPIERNLSIFGDPLIRDAVKSLGQLDRGRGTECLGDIETMTTVAGDSRFSRLEGWLIDKHSARSPRAIYVLDSNRKVVGYGVGGFLRSGLLKDTTSATTSGFVAYVKSDDSEGDLILKGRDLACELPVPHSSKILLRPVSITDPNWIGGIARAWGPAFVVRMDEKFGKQLTVGRQVMFSDGSIRSITEISIEPGDLLIVHVDGALLDGELVGFPNKVELL